MSYGLYIGKNLTSDGQEKWIKSFGNNTNEVAYDIERNQKNEYIITGYSLIGRNFRHF